MASDLSKFLKFIIIYKLKIQKINVPIMAWPWIGRALDLLFHLSRSTLYRGAMQPIYRVRNRSMHVRIPKNNLRAFYHIFLTRRDTRAKTLHQIQCNKYNAIFQLMQF